MSTNVEAQLAEKKRNLAVDYLVYLLIRTIICIVQALPMSAGYAIARWIAWFAHTVDRRHRETAMRNLEIAFGDRYTVAERAKLIERIYEHFARMIIEIAFIPRKMHVSNWKKYARLENANQAVQCMLDDRPTIIVTGHFGNWEMAGYLLAAIGMPSYAIARDLDNPYLHRFLLKFREWSGQTILSKSGDFDRIQKVLVDKKILISVGDQSAGPRGYFVDFFGKPASTHKAIAILAMQHNARVLVGYGYRDQPGFHYSVGCSRVLDPADYANIPSGALAMTRDFTRLLEEVIRKAPEQYLWLHNRWKHDPPAARRAA